MRVIIASIALALSAIALGQSTQQTVPITGTATITTTPGPQGATGLAGPVGPAGATGATGKTGATGASPSAASVASALAATPSFVTAVAAAMGSTTTPPCTVNCGGTTPPPVTCTGTACAPSGAQFVFYSNGVTQSPGDYDYSGVTSNYNAAPLVVDPLYPTQTKVVSNTYPAGQNGGFQPRMPGDFLAVAPYTYLWIRVLPVTGGELYFMGAEAPGDTAFYLSGGAQNVTQYLTAPAQAKVWNWLRVPFKTINGGWNGTSALYKYSLVMSGAPGTEVIQVGPQIFSAN